MFKPIPLYIGFRYTRAKKRNQFVSFISLASMIGIALGVMVLITVLSVMNGFDQQIKSKIFSFVPHITMTGPSGSLANWPELAKKVKGFPGVTNFAPYVYGQGLLTQDNSVRPIIVKGIDPNLEGNVSDVGKKMVEGKLANLKPGKFGIVLGENLAMSLGVGVGDKINLITPQASITPVGVLPRMKRFTVVGVFQIGTGFKFDDQYAYIQMNDAQKLFTMGNNVSGLQLKIQDLFAAEPMTLQLNKKFNWKYQVSNWTDQFGPFYHAVQMEKTMMFFILLLIIAVAAFNLVASLVMVVNDKQADIAIMRTIGATPKFILSIFVVQGTVIGVVGTLLGILGGVVLSLNVTRLVNFIQNTLHVQLFTPGVYWVNYLPSQLQWMDVFHICVAALLMSLVATLYPAWSASRTKPAEALRYE